MEVELDREETTEEKLPTEEENLKLSAEDLPVSIRSETELTSLSEEDGEGKEIHDEEVPVSVKTICTLDQVKVNSLLQCYYMYMKTRAYLLSYDIS